MIFAGTTATGGVKPGTGSMLTLTPQDAERDRPAMPGRQRRGPARPRPGTDRLWQPELGSRADQRHHALVFGGARLAEHGQGEMFSDRDVRNGAKVCVIGETVKREPVSGRVADRQGNSHQQRLLPRRSACLSRKGANMMGMDQDNIVLAPGPPSSPA